MRWSSEIVLNHAKTPRRKEFGQRAVIYCNLDIVVEKENRRKFIEKNNIIIGRS